MLMVKTSNVVTSASERPRDSLRSKGVTAAKDEISMLVKVLYCGNFLD